MAKTTATRTTTEIERAGLTDDQLIAMFRTMLLQRQLDNRGFQLNRQGKIPFALGSEGHEGVQAGAAMAFKRGADVLVPYYRDLGLAMGVGMTPYEILSSMFARTSDRSMGRQFPNHYTNHDLGVLSISSIIAGHCTHAVGVAAAMKYKRQSGRAVLCTTGEGATSQGEWHESVNYAAVHNLPIVFLVENNAWAISTPQEMQMRIVDVIDKAEGYGIPSSLCDGLDPIATYATMHAALERARSGGGPTLVEAKCYRFLSHSTDDDDRTYRSRDSIEQARLKDPVPVFERRLIAAGVMDAASVAALRADVLDETNDATDRAEAQPYPDASTLYTNVTADDYRPWREN
jgi:2-oxoisovalerate dehydrogenase E1 component alpha subunit